MPSRARPGERGSGCADAIGAKRVDGDEEYVGAARSRGTFSSRRCRGGEPRDLTPGDFDSPPTQQEDAALAFTPDGKELVFVSNRDGIDKEAYSTNNDVWSVRVAAAPQRS